MFGAFRSIFSVVEPGEPAMKTVTIGDHFIGEGQPCFIVAEIGINHNGDIDHAKRLIGIAAEAGCDAVKFQKRTVEVVYTPEELEKPRESPFGHTQRDLKYGLEFDQEEYDEIDHYCRSINMLWFASPWDEGSVDFLEQYELPAYKIASASLTDDHLLRHVRRTGRPIILSTGMSTFAEIDHAVEVLGKADLILMHATSTYPANYDELNLSAIATFAARYNLPVGYSGHETGICTSLCAAVLGACCVERHLTTDRSLWGSDQAASLEPNGMKRLVRDIRLWEQSKGDGIKRVYQRELPIIKKLRRIGAAAS
jgi:N-acetylneuraminate synthase